MTVPYVVPFAGTWIETGFGSGSAGGAGVVPFAGTWIETKYTRREGKVQ